MVSSFVRVVDQDELSVFYFDILVGGRALQAQHSERVVGRHLFLANRKVAWALLAEEIVKAIEILKPIKILVPFPTLTTFTLFSFFSLFVKSVPPCLVRLRQFVLGASSEIHATPSVQRTPVHFEPIMKSILLFERYDSQKEKPFKEKNHLKKKPFKDLTELFE